MFKKFTAMVLVLACLFLSACASNDRGYEVTRGEYVTTEPETTVPETTAETKPPVVDITATLESSAAFVCDSEGYILMKKSGDGVVYPASLTKLLTAVCALTYLEAETVVEVGDEVYLIGKNSSVAYILPGHALSVEMLVEAMLLPSGNDAAYVVAAAAGREILKNSEAAPKEAVNAFVVKMNEYAKALGCTGSNFTVPDGLAGSEHYSTIEDMALIFADAARNVIVRKYASMASDDVTYASGHTNHWSNSNLQLQSESEFYNENVIGLKTGSLTDYYCLATLYKKGEKEYMVGTFGSFSKEGRYRDTAALIESIDALE